MYPIPRFYAQDETPLRQRFAPIAVDASLPWKTGCGGYGVNLSEFFDVLAFSLFVQISRAIKWRPSESKR